MSLVSLDTLKYISKPLIAGSLMYAKDTMFEKQPYNSHAVYYDVLTMSGSTFVNKLIKDLIVDSLHLNEETIQYKIIEPIINAFIYSYAYDYVVVSAFGGINNRENKWIWSFQH